MSENIKPWITDVPVAINFFARPDTLEKVFEVIRRVRPRQLFLIADGPRPNVPADIENCGACRKLVENIDWDCEAYRFYNDENKGLWVTYFSQMERVFRIVDRCVFLEDDVVVSDSFFEYQRYLLEKYKNDLRISFVTSINFMGEYEKPDGDYFFCGEGSLTAYGLWKRTFDSMNLAYCNNLYAIQAMSSVAKQVKPGYEKRIQNYVADPNWQGHIPHVEVYKNMLRFSQNQICIVPTRNLVTNIGVGNNASHSANDVRKLPKATQRIFLAKRFEYEFPLRDPEFVIPDKAYEKEVNYILAWNNPCLKFLRRMEALVRHIRYGDAARVTFKVKEFFSRSNKE